MILILDLIDQTSFEKIVTFFDFKIIALIKGGKQKYEEKTQANLL